MNASHNMRALTIQNSSLTPLFQLNYGALFDSDLLLHCMKNVMCCFCCENGFSGDSCSEAH